jgi:hypothetical protein
MSGAAGRRREVAAGPARQRSRAATVILYRPVAARDPRTLCPGWSRPPWAGPAGLRALRRAAYRCLAQCRLVLRLPAHHRPNPAPTQASMRWLQRAPADAGPARMPAREGSPPAVRGARAAGLRD